MMIKSNRRSYHILDYALCIPLSTEIRWTAELKSLVIDLFREHAERNGVQFISHEFRDEFQDENCVIFFFSAETTTELSKFVNSYKTLSSRRVKSLHKEIENSFWSSTYFICSLGAKESVEDFLVTYKNTLQKRG